MTTARPLHEHIADALTAMCTDGATPDEIAATTELVEGGYARVIVEATPRGPMCVVTLPLDSTGDTYWELLAVPAGDVQDLPVDPAMIEAASRIVRGDPLAPDDASAIETRFFGD